VTGEIKSLTIATDFIFPKKKFSEHFSMGLSWALMTLWWIYAEGL
jgi:hypothetical protein